MARPESHHYDDQITKLTKAGLSNKGIAAATGLSEVWVYTIRKRLGLTQPKPAEGKWESKPDIASIASDCGMSDLVAKILDKDPDELRSKLCLPLHAALCLECHKPIPGSVSRSVYPGQSKVAKEEFCSQECRRKYHTIEAVCDVCGKPFSISQAQLLHRIARNASGWLTCSHKCSEKGLWMRQRQEGKWK